MADENTYFGEDDLVTNTANRVPFCICADISGSMARPDPASGKVPIEALNEFINDLMKYIRESQGLADSVEVAVVTFQSEVEVVRDFATCKEGDPEITLQAKGGTALAHGVSKALEILYNRKAEFQAKHIPYYQPVLVLVTDGKPGDAEDLPPVEQQCADLANQAKLSIFPIVIGSDDNEPKWREIVNILKPLSPKHDPMHLKGLKFEKLMDFLVQSMEHLVTDNPTDGGAPVATAVPDIGGGWNEW